MSARFHASNQVAIVGYAQSPILRHAPQTLGALAVDTARGAIADAGLRVEDIDGFVGSSLLPTSGAHRVEDGVSIVSPNWLAQHLGINPRYSAGFSAVWVATWIIREDSMRKRRSRACRNFRT